jgi:hypothetical protein
MSDGSAAERDAENNSFDVWTSRYAGSIPWRVVDEFLALNGRKGPHVQDRHAIEGSGKEGVTRVVETIGAMANRGGGLIFVGFRQGADDRPATGPLWASKR